MIPPCMWSRIHVCMYVVFPCIILYCTARYVAVDQNLVTNNVSYSVVMPKFSLVAPTYITIKYHPICNVMYIHTYIPQVSIYHTIRLSSSSTRKASHPLYHILTIKIYWSTFLVSYLFYSSWRERIHILLNHKKPISVSLRPKAKPNGGGGR